MSQDELWRGFVRSAQQFPQRTALVVEGQSFSYQTLYDAAIRIACTIQYFQGSPDPPLTAVFAYRSPVAFAGVLGALLAGNGYVPLNRTFPAARTRMMFDRSQSRSIIIDTPSLPQLDALLAGHDQQLLIVAPDVEELREYRDRWPQHLFVDAASLKSATVWREPTQAADAIAYLLFTSGSTGIPKGVVVAQRNVMAFIDHMVDHLQITEQDALSQMFDFSFDLSVFDMFVSWQRGACVCCASQRTLLNPGPFIAESGLTIWFSVPSTALFMKKLGLLRPGRFPLLRWSLFCGEPLPVSLAEAWLKAASNSVLENLYGPTELTIACTGYRWLPEQSKTESELGIVPIGYAYPGMDTLVVDENLHEVNPGEAGELLMSGPQLSLGYWQDREKTKSAFVVPPGRTEVFYRTGDRVRRPVGKNPLTYLGRLDFQIKVLGHRVELGEVEAAVREATGLDGVVAVGWPVTESGYGGIEAFIEGQLADIGRLRGLLVSRLPDYMVPRRFHCLESLPRNANGKFDRNAMSDLLGEGL